MLGFWRTALKIANFEARGLFGGFSLGDPGRHGSGGIFEGPWTLVLAFWGLAPKIAHFEVRNVDFENFSRRPWPSRFWRNL